MTSKRKFRIWYIVVTLFGLATVLGLILFALRQNIDLYFTPTELYNTNHAQIQKQQIRIGGMVQAQSLQILEALKVRFVVTDFTHNITVEYVGILPDLFKEGQGVVATGRLHADNIFIADQILAKHDQNYMPPR